MPTIFTRIIQGDIPGTFVHRDEHCVAFLSINPLNRGHVLVVPIDEVDHWIDLSDSVRGHLFEVAHRIAQAQSAAFGCPKVGMVIAGHEVPHAHIHLVPTWHIGHLDFSKAARNVERTDLEAAAAAIRTHLA